MENQMNNTLNLTSILHDALADYTDHADSCTPSEWLQGYLGEKLPSQSVDVIHAISSGIIETIDLMEEKKAALDTAVENGKSAENWIANDITQESGNNGEKARMVAAFFNGIVKAEKSLDETIEAEEIDIAEDASEWQDSNWNDYKLKDSLKSMAVEAGKAGLKEVASDVFIKASEEGVAAALTDGEFMTDVLVGGASSGLKVAVSAGLAIAQSSGFIPTTTIQVIAVTAHKTVESMKSFAEVIKGKATVTEALVNIKNTAISTFAGMWKMHKNQLLEEATDMVGTVFGAPGAIIAGAASGLIVDSKEESRLKTVLKEAGKAALRFLTKEIHIPLFSKNKALQLHS